MLWKIYPHIHKQLNINVRPYWDLISRFHPTRYRYTGSAELLHHAFGSVGRSCMKQNPSLKLKADYIEHRFEARAMLPPICDALRNRLFLFSQNIWHGATPWNRCRFQNWMTVRMGYDFAMTWAKQRRGETPGQERDSGKTAKRKVRQSANLTLWQKRKKRKGWVA